MSHSRRHFLKTTPLASGSLLLQPMLQRFALEAAGVERAKMPQRFVFVMKSSGIIPEKLEPPTLQDAIQDKTISAKASLSDHTLSETLKPLEALPLTLIRHFQRTGRWQRRCGGDVKTERTLVPDSPTRPVWKTLSDTTRRGGYKMSYISLQPDGRGRGRVGNQLKHFGCRSSLGK